MSSPLPWQKSSFSGGGGDTDCLEIATGPTTLHLRESDHPTTVLSPSPSAFRALLATVKETA
ncbi:DUF397 domain-containing protein [Streptomyces albiflavescens]|uniref:DUF397 domain-containing protein n=1 Tax=Streptomyces albiflavescens TaxID=1623582 RepID=UPI00166902EC|nr:DUF397 domain-containing protein [Streptomyces albiflavescens]